MQEGLKLATHTTAQGIRKAEGFATPTQDQAPQVARFPPKRVLPIVFLPGIMGSNLKITSRERQELLKQKDNKAWRPDELGVGTPAKTFRASSSTPEERQLRLDPLTTSVDVYDPSGKTDVSGDERQSNVQLDKHFESPLLADDVPTKTGSQTAVQKARHRGWGEVMFKSYGQLLQHLEMRMNNTFFNDLIREEWRDVINVDPAQWEAERRFPQQALTEEEFKKAVMGCMFPVHAFGYNWLRSNSENAKTVAKRINALIQQYVDQGHECEKVIVVTHSMGGLVARALVHPDYGNIKDKVLGMVHGVMPATGAAATYRRIRAGFENPLKPESMILGNSGDEVTAVLSNSPGGLELLPSKAYGNEWLKFSFNGEILKSLPKQGDPYKEIYQVRSKWYSLFNEDWINPSGLDPRKGGGSFSRTKIYLDQARVFHEFIADCYHDLAYAHYGIDPAQKGWGDIVWKINTQHSCSVGWDTWTLLKDSKQGKVMLKPGEEYVKSAKSDVNGGTVLALTPAMADILEPNEAGDGTVPMRSSDAQMKSGKFKAVFRQRGYEHQKSYQNPHAVASTRYCIVRIAQKAQWKGRP